MPENDDELQEPPADIVSSDALRRSSFTPEMGQRLFQQVVDIWINPELQRRSAAGLVDESFVLNAAQIIFRVDKPPEVRINNEVKIAIRVKLRNPKLHGEPVLPEEIESIHGMELTGDDVDGAHITLLRKGGDLWDIEFDAQYNRSKAKALAQAAAEFLAAAKASLQSGHFRPFVDNLYSAAELSAKAQLVLIPNPKMLSATSHGFVVSQFNIVGGKMGNAPGHHVNLINRLSDMRSKAKYSPESFKLAPDVAEQMMLIGEEMVDAITRRLSV